MVTFTASSIGSSIRPFKWAHPTRPHRRDIGRPAAVDVEVRLERGCCRESYVVGSSGTNLSDVPFVQ